MKYRLWIFDLDNTLHFSDKKIFPIVNKKMDTYIQKKLRISKQKASILRQKYWDLYGATLPGLIKHHQINAEEFLRITHDLTFDEKIIFFPRNINHMLSQINGIKIIFTNAPKIYTEKILKYKKIYSLFKKIHSIEDSKFYGKPHKYGYYKLLKKNKFKYGVMVDDVKENLKIAKKMGFTTIWLSGESFMPNYIDYKIKSLHKIKRLRIS